MRISIIILLFLTCSVSLCMGQDIKQSIVGKWTIEEQKIIGEYNGKKELKNTAFFGPEIWSKAVGKQFEFTIDGTVNTNLAEINLSEKIKLTYKLSENEPKLIFTATQLTNPLSVVCGTQNTH